MNRKYAVTALAAATAMTLAACGGSSTATEETASAGAAAPASAAATATSFAAANYTTPLADVCPANLVVQKDWLAEVEHNALYQLIGSTGEMSQFTYTGPLGSTGINLTILDGGPGLGQGGTPISSLYAGNPVAGVTPDLAYVYTDEAIQFSKQFPTLSVFAPLDRNPQGLMFDPSVYPKIENLEELKAAYDQGAKAYVTSKTSSYVRYLIAQGIPEDMFVEGYAGDLDKMITNEGKWVNQGYQSNEPYTLVELTPDWGGKPVNFVNIYQLGLRTYPMAFAIAADRKDELAPCLTKLVPLLQQAAVDYAKDPAEVNAIIAEYNDKELGASFWKTSTGLNDNAHKVMLEMGALSNGEDDTFGNFDLARVQEVIDLMAPLYVEAGMDSLNPDVKPEDIVTNEFIDPSISLK